MIKAERHEHVKALLDAHGTISVKEISDALDVSEMTVRRDLEELSASGDVERVHGGARRCTSPVHSMLRHEYTHTEKRDKNVAEKAEAACLAAGQKSFRSSPVEISTSPSFPASSRARS